MIFAQFIIPGTPLPKERPRFSTKSGAPRTYTTAKTRNYETVVANYAKQGMKRNDPFTGPVAVDMCVFMPIPPSWSKKDRVDALAGIKRHTKHPDVDNLAKIILDACNKVCYKDDSQVWRLTISKCYSDNPRVDVMMQTMEGCR